MADKKFSELDPVGSLTGTEILPVIKEGLPKRTTVADVVANYVLKSGDTITGNYSPTTDSTYTLGTSSLYWKETYTDRLYLNSTAYLDGGTAGTLNVNANIDMNWHELYGAWNISAHNTITAGGDVEITDATKGVILKSPDGTRYRLTAANGGTLTISAA